MPVFRLHDLPPGYLVEGSPNEGEDGWLACPRHGCDGLSFDSAEECHAHERDWHGAPYRCGRCGARCAARPALARHERACGRAGVAAAAVEGPGRGDRGATTAGSEREDGGAVAAGLERKDTGPPLAAVCAQRECLLEGVEFPDQASYLSHALGSAAHEEGGDEPPWEAGDGEMRLANAAAPKETLNDAEEPEAKTADAAPDATTPDADEANAVPAPEDSPLESGFMCFSACCPRYETPFASYREYMRHARSHGHVSAEALNAALFSAPDLTMPLLDARRAAFRALRCGEPACADCGRVFSSSQSYARHLRTPGHRESHAGGGPGGGEKGSRRAGDDAGEREALPTVCAVELCAKFEHRFSSPWGFRAHCETAAHRRAERVMGARRVGAAPDPATGPMTPPPSAGLAGTLSTPPRAREESLARQNRELEERVRQLEAELEGYKAAEAGRWADPTPAGTPAGTPDAWSAGAPAGTPDASETGA